MGNKWVRLLLAAVISIGIFIGVVAFVADFHPLGGSQGPYARQEACIAQNQYDDQARDLCYREYHRASERVYEKERWIAVASGVAAVVLFWLLVNQFYLKPRRRRQEEADAA